MPVALTAMETALAAAGISASKAVEGLSQLTLKDTRPGDIILWYPEPNFRSGVPDGDFMHRLTAGAQLATAAITGKDRRSAGFVHAFMWTRDNAGGGEQADVMAAEGAVFEIAGDMTGKRNTIETRFRPAPFMTVHRHEDEALARRAAEIALIWQDKLDRVPFDMPSAALSVLAQESFTDEARQRAERYGANALSPDPDLLSDGVYCSSAVIALFQAAALSLDRELVGAFRVDAAKVSPRDLHYHLERDPAIKLVGFLAEEAEPTPDEVD